LLSFGIALIAGFWPSEASAADGAGLRVDRLSVENGLSQTTVWTVVQDSRGFIWMGTEEGLNRHDGYRFKIFEHAPEDPRSLAELEVHSLCEDSAGELWIGTAGGGLDRFDRADESFHHHRHDPANPTSLSNNHILSLGLDSAGQLWVGTEDGLNLRRTDGTFERFLVDLPSSTPSEPTKVWKIHGDRAGGLWLGTNHGLYYRDPVTSQFQNFIRHTANPHSLPSNMVYAVAEGPERQLWVGTEAGLCRFDSTRGLCAATSNDPENASDWPQGTVNTLYFDRAGELWVGTLTSGLYRKSPQAEEFQSYRHDPADPHSLNDDSIVSLYEDRSGTLWLGTYVGVNKYDHTRAAFTTYRHRPGQAVSLSSNSAWALHQSRNGELWVGTYNHGLNRFDRERHSVTIYSPNPDDPQALPDGAVNALWEDRTGFLWVGTWGGLARFDPVNETFLTWKHDPTDPTSLANDLVSALLEDRQGRLWVGTYDGVQYLDRKSGHFHRSEDFPEIPIHVLFEDHFGVLWAGSDRGPLFYRPPTNNFAAFKPSRSVPVKVVSIHEDLAGHLWMGTLGRGLYHFDLDRHPVARYGKAQGLPNSSVLGILPDEEGHLWLSTNRGLVRFDPDAETFELFDADDGLQSSVFSSNSSLLGQGGELFFGGVQGLNAFHPAEVERNPHPPVVALTDFQLFDRSVPLQSADARSPLKRPISDTRKLVLTHRDYVFSLEFAALHFKSPRKNRYAYRLRGFDAEWIETNSQRRSVRYSNLAPGGYIFQVKASNADGVWSEDSVDLHITVLPPPWKTWWAYLLYSAITTLILFASWRSSALLKQSLERLVEERTARIEELNTELKARNGELEGFTYTVSHDLKSPLITIQGFLGLLRQDLIDGNSERVEHDCSRISQAATNMQQLLNDLLELSRIGRLTNQPKQVSFDELIQETLELLTGPLAERGVSVCVETGLPTVFGDRLRLREVIQNLLENAIKYLGDQPTPRIKVGVELRQGESAFFIRDNGIGISSEHQERIFGLFQQLNPKNEGTGIGLALVRRIVEFHGGRVWAESQGLGRGTTFLFTLQGPPKASP
jgi:ligand-binding sensor domain-containing protein/signal transduction histidine kinase